MDLNRIGGTAGFWNNYEGLHEGGRELWVISAQKAEPVATASVP